MVLTRPSRQHVKHIEGALYSIILTWEKTGKRGCFEENLNQNLSKYIAVAEESYPFLIRDKKQHLRVQTIRRVEMYFCKIVANSKKIKRTRSHAATAGSIIWNEQRTNDGLFITCICHITAAWSRDFSRAWHIRNNMKCMCGIIYVRKITIYRSLFRSELCFLMQYIIRGEILVWIIYWLWNFRAYFR